MPSFCGFAITFRHSDIRKYPLLRQFGELVYQSSWSGEFPKDDVNDYDTLKKFVSSNYDSEMIMAFDHIWVTYRGKIKIIGIASDICWWKDCVGQICPILDVYEPTGFIKIRVTRKEPGFSPYEIEGWIDQHYVELVPQGYGFNKSGEKIIVHSLIDAGLWKGSIPTVKE